MTEPLRLQRSRAKGWRMPDGAVYVGRPTKWGNPFVANDWRASFRAVFLSFRGDRAGCHAAAVHLFELWMTGQKHPISQEELDRRGFMDREVMTVKVNEPASLEEIRSELRGRTLVCWCRLDEPCHADVLLRLANIPLQCDAPETTHG